MKKVAFISEEFAIENLPIFAGGLGILAGDLLYSAEDLDYNLYGVTFVNKKGYAAYKIQNKDIILEDESYDPLEYFKLQGKTYIDLKNGFKIYFNIWKYNLKHAKLFLIDTDVPENNENIKKLTDKLYYEENEEESLLKALLLGLGSIKIFEYLGINIDLYHLNESHGGFLVLDLLKNHDIDFIKKKVLFTTHSPVAGHLSFDYNLVSKYYDIPEFIKNISKDRLNLTILLLSLLEKKNAVSLKHKYVSEMIFGYKLDYITNGVYHKRWINNKMGILYDTYLKNWENDPTKFSYASIINKKDLESVKKSIKKDLLNIINTEGYNNKSFEEDRILISVRRRLTEYKRFHMILWRLDKLEELNKKYRIQFLLSGIFHPKDEYVKNTIKWILDIMSTLSTPISLILKRGIELEKYILAGTDLFLHIPRPPFEACGTSWMRAALNATPTLYSRDGGPLEIIIDDYNGWFFGVNRYNPYEKYDENKDIEDFYNKLNYILNIIRNNKNKYLDISINTLKTVGPLFNSYRNFLDYVYKFYEQ